MNLQCGYLPETKSSCYHPVQNVNFWGSNWKTCQVILDKKTLHTITNNNKKFTVEQTLNNSYGIELRVNGQKIYEHPQLYYVELIFDSTPDYELIQTIIVDQTNENNNTFIDFYVANNSRNLTKFSLDTYKLNIIQRNMSQVK